MFTIEKERDITTDIVAKYIKRHQGLQARYNKLADYYDGKHAILTRSKTGNKANNRIVCNHAKHISDTATGYTMGEPIKLNPRTDGVNIDALTDWLRIADADTQDMDVGKDASIFGIGCELVYMSDDDAPTPRLASFDPRSAFVVYDDTVEHRPRFGVYYYALYDDDGQHNGYACKWYSDTQSVAFKLNNGFGVESNEKPTLNPFGEVPLIEYYNNEECQGDFEQVISLIDAYNILQSDRINDKQQFVDAVLVLKGMTLGDDADEQSAALKSVRENGLLELDADGAAEWLTRTFDESSVDILRKSIEQDIHRFSGIPCMDDENFASNSSGVAMKYKLLGFEQVVKIKERYFREGLKIRLRLFCNMLATKGAAAIDPNDVDIVFTRNLPANEVELAQVVSMLQGMVPDQALLSILPFVKDPQAAADELQEQKAEAVRQQQAMFAAGANTAPEEDVTEDEE